MRALNNSEIPGFTAKAAELGSEDYSARVAAPVMSAVDRLPPAYRALVNEYGYVNVYRAWRAGWSPEQIFWKAKDGTFDL